MNSINIQHKKSITKDIENWIPLSTHGTIKNFENLKKRCSIGFSQFKLINLSSLVKVESSHLLMGHLIKTILQHLKQTIPGYQTQNWNRCISSLWNECVQLFPFRASKCTKTNMSTYSSKDTLKMKEISMYCHAFEWSVHGSMFHPSPKHLQLLQQVMQWIGISFSDTCDNVTLKHLRNSFADIVKTIEELDDLATAFMEKQTLQLWKKMIFSDWFFDARPTQSFGLKFESSHLKSLTRLQQNQNYKKKTMLFTITQKRRVSKNVFFAKCNMISPTDRLSYGNKIWENKNSLSTSEKKSMFPLR